MTSVTDSGNHVTGFGYNPNGDLTSINYADGSVSTRRYNAEDQVTHITDTQTKAGKTVATLDDLAYTRDAAQLITSQNIGEITGTGALTATTETIGHDKNGRVTQVTTPQPAGGGTTGLESYGYDPTNSITSRSTTSGATSSLVTDALSYDAAGELTKITNSLATESFGYDGVGERVSDTVTPVGSATGAPQATSFHYNQAGELTSYDGAPVQAFDTRPGATLHLTYGYDGLGRRGDLTYDTAEPGPGGAAPIASDAHFDYVTGPGGLVVEQVVRVGGYQPVYLHSDALGSTRVATGPDDVPLISFDYDAYGRTSYTKLADLTGLGLPSAVTPIQYAGSYTDLRSGLVYNRARWYDPHTADFLTVDPALAVTGQPYAYANGDPIDLIDPLGLCGHWYDVACQIGSAATAVGGAAVSGAQWVGDHPWQTAGLVAGGVAAATGVGALADLTILGLDAGALGTVSVGAGLVAGGADIPGCVSGSFGSCVGVVANSLGGSLGLAGRFAGEGSVLFDLLGAKAFSFGAGALAWDPFSALAEGSTSATQIRGDGSANKCR